MRDEAKLKKILLDLDHAVRTPLGVALNVVADGARGHALERRDFADAQESLQKIRDLLDSAREALLAPEEQAQS